MTIIFAILKMIGWTVLILFLVLVLLLLLILFFPVSYQVEGCVQERDVSGHVRVSWLFRLINFHFFYDGKQDIYIRIFGVRIRLPRKKSDTKESKETLLSEKITEEEVVIEENSDEEEEVPDKIKKVNLEFGTQEESNENQEKQSSSVRLFYGNTKNRWSSLKRKISDLEKASSNWKEQLQEDFTQKACSHIKCESIRLLKAIMPDKLFLKLTYSTGSPDTTAWIFGGLAMFPIGYTNRWNIQPDFEADEWYAIGDAVLKGHIFLFKMIAIVVRLILDKNCRQLAKQWLN